MNTLLETLFVSGFPLLSMAEVNTILMEIDRHVDTLDPSITDYQRRKASVHSADGFSVDELKAIYEPNGRLELVSLPASITDAVTNAVQRQLPLVQRLLPSVTGIGDWIYVEYGVGQYITPHIDGVSSPTDSRKQIAGIGVWLNDDFEGGEFAVSTVIDENLFGENRNEFVAYGVDNSVPWFRALCTTTWTAKPAAGDVLLYGSQTIHSTRPVVKGKARRLINFLTANG
ncbi:2OG-Fe(II) oxygenase [Burkholderia sp. BCC0044]|uniref:2OG-Fe(II) oxygenase n=1 Tax=Burkholderia sp. BCC0044 TaxID=2676295 RepID=UPI0015883E70|nr:2OG-Fe(II) oxygenase [Burkholderia sp. BCC0044]